MTFTGATSFAVDVPCTYDLEVAASKYFYSLPDGEVPLTFLFNGMVLYAGEHDRLQVAQVPWSCTARWRMPVDAWKAVIAVHGTSRRPRPFAVGSSPSACSKRSKCCSPRRSAGATSCGKKRAL